MFLFLMLYEWLVPRMRICLICSEFPNFWLRELFSCYLYIVLYISVCICLYLRLLASIFIENLVPDSCSCVIAYCNDDNNDVAVRRNLYLSDKLTGWQCTHKQTYIYQSHTEVEYVFSSQLIRPLILCLFQTTPSTLSSELQILFSK